MSCPTCLNDGKCHNGVCHCQKPYGGDDCSIIGDAHVILDGNVLNVTLEPHSVNYFTATFNTPHSITWR